MKGQKPENKELDRIGSRLLTITKTPDAEIEKVVGSSQLFASIQRQIESDGKSNTKMEHGFVKWNWLKSSFLNRQAAISASAILVVFAVFAALVFVKNQESTNAALEKKIKTKPQIQPETAKNEELLNDSEIAEDFTPKKSESNKQIIFGITDKSSKPIRKTNPAKSRNILAKNSDKPKRLKTQKNVNEDQTRVAKKEPQKIFYSLPFAETGETGNENLRLVSTEFSRSELFALGVNLQLENENSTVKTELLVGQDGIARAIRLVEKY